MSDLTPEKIKEILSILFILPKGFCDEIILKADGDILIIKRELGFPEGYTSGGIPEAVSNIIPLEKTNVTKIEY